MIQNMTKNPERSSEQRLSVPESWVMDELKDMYLNNLTQAKKTLTAIILSKT